MNSTQKLLLVGVVSTAAVLLGLIGGIVYTYWHEDEILSRMVKDGADPMRASCAMSPTTEQCRILYYQPSRGN